MTPREAERRRELAVHVERSWQHVEELFDRHRDGLAADRRFKAALRGHAILSGESYCTLLSRLIQAERKLRRAFEHIK